MPGGNGSSPATATGRSRPSTYLPAYPKRTGFRLAVYWQRAGALLVDLLLFVITVAAPATLIVWWFGDVGAIVCSWDGNSEVCPGLTAADIRLSRITFYSLATVFLALYAYRVGQGATIGRRTTQYKIVDAVSGQPIGFGRGLLRSLAMAVSAAPLMLGFLWPLWDRERRTFHDMIARTRAVSP